MIRKVGIRFRDLPDEGFDAPLGLGTGAAVIFGTTGGVMEAALRTAVETLTGEELQSLDFTEVRGMEGIKEATYPVAGMEVKVAVASGLGNAKKLLDKVKSGEAEYHFIEVYGMSRRLYQWRRTASAAWICTQHRRYSCSARPGTLRFR